MSASGGSGSDPVVALARRAIHAYVCEDEVIEGELPADAGPDRAGTFVSLHRPDGSLRGCIGTFTPAQTTLGEEVVRNAIQAATRDPRFPPLSPEELSDLHVSVDILGEPEEVEGFDSLDPQRYGIIVRAADGRQALLLPDLEGVETAEQQVALTCRKGGIHPAGDRYRLFRFEVDRRE